MLGGFLNVQTLQTVKHRKDGNFRNTQVKPFLPYPEMVLLRITWHSQDHDVSFFDRSLRPKEQLAAKQMGGMSCEKINVTPDDCVSHLHI